MKSIKVSELHLFFNLNRKVKREREKKNAKKHNQNKNER